MKGKKIFHLIFVSRPLPIASPSHRKENTPRKGLSILGCILWPYPTHSCGAFFVPSQAAFSIECFSYLLFFRISYELCTPKHTTPWKKRGSGPSFHPDSSCLRVSEVFSEDVQNIKRAKFRAKPSVGLNFRCVYLFVCLLCALSGASVLQKGTNTHTHTVAHNNSDTNNNNNDT